jgi:hypothetical protein
MRHVLLSDEGIKNKFCSLREEPIARFSSGEQNTKKKKRKNKSE